MRLLFIGGTQFVGRHMVQVALARGHEVTVFHRGQRGNDLFPEVERIQGDRTSDVSGLEGKTWDAVIDTCGYYPRAVRLTVDALRDNVPHYTFISTISVYDLASAGDSVNEDSPLATLEDETVEEITGETYGGLKVLCEEVVNEAYGARALIIRPGLIVGPNDHSDRFTYWPVRMHRGGDVLAPDRKDQPVQFIDVRDLAEFTISMVERGASGTFNGTAPSQPYSLGEVIEKCRDVVNPSANIVWVPTEVLAEKNVEPWADLPFVLPFDGSADAMSRADVSRAVSQGLTFRPLETTIRDTVDWALSRGEDYELKTGMKADREAEVLGEIQAKA